MFLPKAFKPVRLFDNSILALLQNIAELTYISIDEGFKQDLQCFIACAHAINETLSVYKYVQPWLDLYVDASLHGLGVPLGGRVGVLHIVRPSTLFLHYRSSLLISVSGWPIFGVIFDLLLASSIRLWALIPPCIV
jgi:hypothetical protein